MSPKLLALCVTLLSVALMAMTCDPFENPCADDAFGCDDAEAELRYDDTCTLDGPLGVEVGWGVDAFHPFTDAGPQIYSGSQGGQHVFLAADVFDADLNTYDQLAVTFTLYQVLPRDQCDELIAQARDAQAPWLPDVIANDPTIDGAPGLPLVSPDSDRVTELPALDVVSKCLSRFTWRELLVSSGDDITVREDGSVGLHGIFVQLDFYTEPANVAVVTVEDPCRRQGISAAVFGN